MVTRALFCFALVSTGMIGGALGAGADNASAADDCITESNLVPPKGSRWYYHIDRATNRKCWHIAALASAPPAPRTVRVSAHSELGLTGRRSKHEHSESEQAALFLDFYGGRSSKVPRTVAPLNHRKRRSGGSSRPRGK